MFGPSVLHTHQSVMNVRIEQKPPVDAAWIIITCCRSVNGGSTLSVCRSRNCNKNFVKSRMLPKIVWLPLTMDIAVAPFTLQLPWS